MWLESSSVNVVNLVKKICYNSGDIEFLLGDCFFWRTLYIALNCLFFQKIAFMHFGDKQTDKQTDEQRDSIDALSHSRCRERRLNNKQVMRGRANLAPRPTAWCCHLLNLKP